MAFLRLFSWSASRPFTRAPIRILAATHRNLDALVKAGQFREDLYYRLNVVTVVLPPLRERREDLPLLMDHFLRLFAEKNRKAIRGFTQEARELLLRYDYPGNVRELENIVERAVVLTRDDAIGRSDLPLSAHTLEETESAEKSMPAAVEGVERRMIREAWSDPAACKREPRRCSASASARCVTS